MGKKRWILHVDMDAFYASIEQRDHPEYRDKPLMIGAAPNQRGIISTCSYEARKFGVHSAMPSRTAGRLCPGGIFIPPDIAKYSQESRQIMKVLQSFTPDVEQVSVDEAFLDVTHVEQLWGNPVQLAKRIKTQIRKERGLNASIGVAPNKFLAKLASDLEKPDGLTLITEENKREILATLPISKIWGVGKVTRKLLEDQGFHTMGDVQKTSLRALRSVLGNFAEHIHQLANGEDERNVEMECEAKSISSEHTFDIDTNNASLLLRTIMAHAENIARQLRHERLSTRTIVLKLRYSDFTTITRRKTLPQPTQDEIQIYDQAVALFTAEKTGQSRIRLIGLGTTNFVNAQFQRDFFDTVSEKRQRLAVAVDQLRAQLGDKAIERRID